MWRRLLARLVAVLALVLASSSSHAYTPPKLQGAVTDTADRLSAAEKKKLEARLAAYRVRTTNEVVVFLLPSLGRESIEDVAYGAFNEWGVGKKGKDNGVLLVIAFAEKKLRIETGKGIGDRLTDIESSHINRDRIGPLLRQDRTFDAISAGLDGIEAALDGKPSPPLPEAGATATPPVTTRPYTWPDDDTPRQRISWLDRTKLIDRNALVEESAKAASDRKHWENLVVVFAYSSAELGGKLARWARDLHGDPPYGGATIIMIGVSDMSVELSSGSNWYSSRSGDALAKMRAAMKSTSDPLDGARKCAAIAIATLDMPAPDPPPPELKGEDVFMYGIFGFIGLVFTVVFVGMIKGRRGGSGSSGGGGSSGFDSGDGGSSSFDTSSFGGGGFSSTSSGGGSDFGGGSSSSSGGSDYSGGGGTSGGGGSTDSW